MRRDEWEKNNPNPDFIPNWVRLKFKSRGEGIGYVLAFLKKYEKQIANTGYGTATIKNGYLDVIQELKGDKIKRKKEVIT